MKNDDFEKSMSGLLKTYLENECASPTVQRSKSMLLKSCTGSEPSFENLAAGFLVASLIMALLFSMQMEWAIFPNARPQFTFKKPVEIQAPAPVISEPEFKAPRVSVKRLSSRAGSTMVYQKKMSGIPVTIIWVFPKGV